MALVRSLVSYCSVTMISQTMWAVKDMRHRCDGAATRLRASLDWVLGLKTQAQAELEWGTLMRKEAAMERAGRPCPTDYKYRDRAGGNLETVRYVPRGPHGAL